jgi:hypothetical protein
MTPLTVTLPLLLAACSDYSFNKAEVPPGGDSDARIEDSGGPGVPDILVGPPSWDFGTLDPGASASLELSIANTGDARLVVHDLGYRTTSAELDLDRRIGDNGGLPWLIDPGDSRVVEVGYSPVDDQLDQGSLEVSSNDPDEPVVEAIQQGNGRLFEDFYTGWYVYDDGLPYETTSNPAYVVDHHGDEDLYWYEPSGAHGLLGSSDPTADFAVMRQYVLDRAGAPVVPTGPFSYDADSDLATFEWATFTYFMCDFYLDPHDDPSLYSISSGSVDDGIQVMVNGAILGRITLGQSGSWPLSNAVAGQVNTLIIILVDDSRVDKYIHDLAFYRDGVMVGS